jgi:hypothetical protein
MFQLAAEESGFLRSQFGALKTGRGKHRKYAPYVFTEQRASKSIRKRDSYAALEVHPFRNDRIEEQCRRYL